MLFYSSLLWCPLQKSLSQLLYLFLYYDILCMYLKACIAEFQLHKGSCWWRLLVIRSRIRISEFQLRTASVMTHALNLLTPSKHEAVCSEHHWCSNHEDERFDIGTDDVCLEKTHHRQPLPVSGVRRRKWKSHGSQIQSGLELIACCLFHIFSADFRMKSGFKPGVMC